MRRVNPLGVVARGALSGAAGAALQDRFFDLTKAIAPSSPPDAFVPPQPEQKSETRTETVARRFVEDFMQQGELSPEAKKRGASFVHYGFGASWGVGYGLVAESIPGMVTLPGALLYSTLVWLVGDNLFGEAFRLSGYPRQYPAKNHLYAWAAHLAYGVGLHTTYQSLRGKRGLLLAAAMLGVPRRRRRLGKVITQARRQITHAIENAGLH